MEIVFGVIIVILFAYTYLLSKEVTDLGYRIEYKSKLPLIEEYKNLKRYTTSHRDGFKVQFGILWSDDGECFDIYEIESKLKMLKRDIEANCPKKCGKKKRG